MTMILPMINGQWSQFAIWLFTFVTGQDSPALNGGGFVGTNSCSMTVIVASLQPTAVRSPCSAWSKTPRKPCDWCNDTLSQHVKRTAMRCRLASCQAAMRVCLHHVCVSTVGMPSRDDHERERKGPAGWKWPWQILASERSIDGHLLKGNGAISS